MENLERMKIKKHLFLTICSFSLIFGCSKKERHKKILSNLMLEEIPLRDDIEYPEANGESFGHWVKGFEKRNPEFNPTNETLKRKASLTTPSPRMLEVPEHTPPPVARPYSKMALMASKRMEAEMKKANNETTKPNHKKGNAKQDEKTEVKKTEKTLPKKKPAATKCSDSEGSKKKRDHSNGPVYKVYQEYLAKQKENGATHKEATERWRLSREREELLLNMPEAEKKRRRYT